jgi:hypothetical protein
VAIISVLSRKMAIIGAEKGELLVSTAHDGKSVTLREGETVEVTLADPPAPGKPQTGGTVGTTHLTGAQVAVLTTVLSAAVLAIAAKLALDSKGLTDLEKENAVSPFKFQ